MEPDSPQSNAPEPEESVTETSQVPAPEEAATIDVPTDSEPTPVEPPETPVIESAPTVDPSPEATATPAASPDVPTPATIPASDSNTSLQPTPIQTAPIQFAPILTGRSVEEMHALRVLSVAAQERLVQEKLEHLMDLARKEGTIDRTAARLHLRIAPATATRYLSRLVQEGRLTRHREGDDVVYKVVG
jgi:hypothetical protein